MRVKSPGSSVESEPSKAVRQNIGVDALVVTLLAFALYAITGARFIQWGDPAKLMMFVHDHHLAFGQEEHVGLIAWSLPFSLLPLGEFARRMHLSSAFTLALALGCLHATLIASGIPRAASRVGVAAVAVAHTVWFTGTMFESYPLVLLVLAVAAWLLVVRRRPLWAGVIAGIGVAVHPLCLFGLPGAAFGVWKSTMGRKGVIRLGQGLLIGIAIPVIGVLASSSHASIGEVNWAAATAMYAKMSYPLRNIPLLIGYAGYSFTSPALLLFFVGLGRLSRTQRWTAALFALPHYVVAAFWLPQRSYLIPIPVYFAAAWIIALGAERLLRTNRLRIPAFALILLMPIATYLMAPAIFTRAGLDRSVRDAPYRREATYFLRPWKQDETSARDYLNDLSRVLPDRAVTVGDWVLETTLRSAQRVDGWRPDVEVLNADQHECQTIRSRFGSGRRVFVLDDEPGYLPQCVLSLGPRRPAFGIESLQEISRDGAD